MFGTAELQLRSERNMAVAFYIVCGAFEAVVVVVSDRLAKVCDALRRPEVFRAAFAGAVFAAGQKRRGFRADRLLDIVKL